MKALSIAAVAALMASSTPLMANGESMRANIQSVAPALNRYTDETLIGDVWKRPGLSPRDRSIVTLAAMIARNQTVELPYHLALALDNGLKPTEISELITHLAFYSGWPNAVAAAAATAEVFKARNIASNQLPPASPILLPINRTAEAERAARVDALVGSAFPSVTRNTTEMLFKDLWLRPDLAPRDRSLVTVSALVAIGQAAQMPYHLNRAMDNGLTQTEAAEAFAHLAFYSGWPFVFSAMPIAKDVFEKRPK